MPTYKNKPRQIEAVELIPGVAMPDGVLVRAVTDAPDAYEVYNELHDSWIKTKAGDMIRVDKAPLDCYPIDRTTFDATYSENVPDPEPFGRAAFEAYNESRGGLTWDGKPIPGWDAVGGDIQTAWAAAAVAVLHVGGAPSVLFPFDAEIDFILGQPNFVAGSYARSLRKDGHVIPTKAEKEQAAVAYWMLGLYLTHGAAWREVATAELRRMDAIGTDTAAGQGG